MYAQVRVNIWLECLWHESKCLEYKKKGTKMLRLMRTDETRSIRRCELHIGVNNPSTMTIKWLTERLIEYFRLLKGDARQEFKPGSCSFLVLLINYYHFNCECNMLAGRKRVWIPFLSIRLHSVWNMCITLRIKLRICFTNVTLSKREREITGHVRLRNNVQNENHCRCNWKAVDIWCIRHLSQIY